MTLFRTMQHFCQNAFRKSRSVTAGLKAFRQQSVSLTTARRSNSLGKSFRFDTLEDRTVPTIGLGFAAGFGNVGDDFANDIVVDSFGYSYVTGSFSGTVDFDLSGGVVNRTASGASDGFIAKYGPNGALEWVNRMGHGGADFGTGVAVDSLGNTFVAWTYAVNTNNTNAFIYKYNANGIFQGLYEVSSNNREVTHGITVDANNNVYLVGNFDNNGATASNFGFGFTGTTTNVSGFAVKLSNSLVTQWVRQINGSLGADARGVTVTPQGNVVTVGERTDAGGSRMFAVSYGVGFGAQQWFYEPQSGGGTSQAFDVTNDRFGTVYLTGAFSNTVDFNPAPTGDLSLTSAGDSDIMVVTLFNNGTFSNAVRFGNANRDIGYSINAELNGSQAIVGGEFGFSATDADGVVMQLFADTSGTMTIDTAFYVEGGGFESVNGVAIDPYGNYLSVGQFSEVADFDPFNTYELTPQGNDGFLWRLAARADIFSRTANGQWWVALSNGTGFTSAALTQWASNVVWKDVEVADFNGDGLSDFAGRANGEWWVSINNRNGAYTATRWTTWFEGADWTTVRALDVNGDGMSDIAGRTAGGQWWVAVSNGTSFVTGLWGSWSTAVQWRDIQAVDLNDDGNDDIIGRTNGGQWWVATSNGSTGFTNSPLTTWFEGAGWRNVSTGDFDGNGFNDIIARTAGGQWWVSLNNGSGGFTNTAWGTWFEGANWLDVVFIDFNGDGLKDIVARNAGGQWWIGTNNSANFSFSLINTWSSAAGWHDTQTGDFDGDGTFDVASRTSNGFWYVLSAGGGTELWTGWSEAAGWRDTQTGIIY